MLSYLLTTCIGSCRMAIRTSRNLATEFLIVQLSNVDYELYNEKRNRN